MEETTMKKVLLYSGGTDSWLIDKLWKPDEKIYIDLNARYSKEEITRLPPDTQIVDMSFLGEYEDKNTLFVPFRNLFFLTAAACMGDLICYGAVLGDQGNRDKTTKFIDDTEALLNYCSHGNTITGDRNIKIERRFIQMTKYDILGEYLDRGGDLDEFVKQSFSCYSPVDNEPCWNCKCCYRKFLLAKFYGYHFNSQIEQRMLEYMKTNVIPRSRLKSGTYFAERPYEGKYAEQAMDKFFREYNLNWKDYQ